MQRAIVGLAAALALVIAPPVAAATKTVTITRAGFVPQQVTIAAGDTVTWTNTDTVVHQVVFDKAPCNLTIQPGRSGSCTFRAGGSFNYRDPTQRGSFRGMVTVTGARTSVTVQASRRVVTFGGSVTLSGVVSSQQAGESVVVLAQECGKPAFTRVNAATTTAGGNWTLAVKPTINTVYQVRWKTAESATIAVRVKPRVRLSRVGSRFTVRVSAAQPFVGKFVVFQRYNRARARWVTIRRVVLRTQATPTAGTVVSSARFRTRVARGTRLRALLPQSQAGACYAAAASNVVRR